MTESEREAICSWLPSAWYSQDQNPARLKTCTFSKRRSSELTYDRVTVLCTSCRVVHHPSHLRHGPRPVLPRPGGCCRILQLSLFQALTTVELFQSASAGHGTLDAHVCCRTSRGGLQSCPALLLSHRTLNMCRQVSVGACAPSVGAWLCAAAWGRRAALGLPVRDCPPRQPCWALGATPATAALRPRPRSLVVSEQWRPRLPGAFGLAASQESEVGMGPSSEG